MKNPELLRDACLIDGEWLAATGARLEVRNPANGELVGSVPSFGAAETRRAIDAAQAAFHPWRAKTADERARILKRWFQLMMENQEDLARLMTAEQGKPLAEARGEIAYAASFIEWFAEEARRVYGEVIPSPLNDRRLIVLKQPVGVCAAITPWNFPAAMITRKVAPALAAGCTMVVKPAEQTPLSALALAWLGQQAGIPPGVLNIVTGEPVAIGGELTSNPKVLKLSFTGSTEVGRLLMAQCAPTIKKMSLELGGNAPFIVFDDADLDAAVAGAMASKYRNTGQTCVCSQPLPGAGRRARGLRAEARRRGGRAQGRRRAGGGRDARPADRRRGPGQGRGTAGRCRRQGRARALRRQAPRARRHLLRADRADRRDAGDAPGARGNLRPGGADLQLQG
jgi:succinate-semialdehyde dehydrogenase/glutarate-semialdehyde dehydrogenase